VSCKFGLFPDTLIAVGTEDTRVTEGDDDFGLHIYIPQITILHYHLLTKLLTEKANAGCEVLLIKSRDACEVTLGVVLDCVLPLIDPN
jgi:hypothetical protein